MESENDAHLFYFRTTINKTKLPFPWNTILVSQTLDSSIKTEWNYNHKQPLKDTKCLFLSVRAYSQVEGRTKVIQEVHRVLVWSSQLHVVTVR